MSKGGGKQSPMSNDRPSFPWRTLVAGGVLGAALILSAPEPDRGPKTAGRARLTEGLKAGQSGWQMVIDRKALGWGSDRLQTTLGRIIGEPVPLPPTAETLVHLSRPAGKPVLAIDQDPSPAGPRSSDAVFGGGPSLVFEWQRGAFNLKGNLYASSGASAILSGRLIGVLPFSGLSGFGDGFRLDQLGPLPADATRLLAIDPAVLTFPSTYRVPIQQQWDRWEFFPFETLGKAIGPAMVYARWRGEALFSIAVKDMATVSKAIEQRFPESVIRGDASWSHGARLRGLQPEGPAWVLRGDHLLATRTGGTSRLRAALSQALGAGGVAPRAFGRGPGLMAELQRLAGTEKGWHLLLVMAEPDSPVHWAVLLRWPLEQSSGIAGFLVIEPAASGPREAHNIQSK